MVKRYSVSVSDELASGIEKWKKSISISQVFQEAMEKVIADKEDYHARLDDDDISITSIVKRLRREKQLEDKTWYNNGKDAGFEWAKKASYGNIQTVLAIKEELQTEKKPAKTKKSSIKNDADTFTPIISKFLKNTAEWDTILWKCKCKSGPLPSEAIQWLTGWTDGVAALWHQVKDKL